MRRLPVLRKREMEGPQRAGVLWLGQELPLLPTVAGNSWIAVGTESGHGNNVCMCVMVWILEESCSNSFQFCRSFECL